LNPGRGRIAGVGAQRLNVDMDVAERRRRLGERALTERTDRKSKRQRSRKREAIEYSGCGHDPTSWSGRPADYTSRRPFWFAGNFRRSENTRAKLFIRNQNPGCAMPAVLDREALTFLKNS
jgi:hypothetical protein